MSKISSSQTKSQPNPAFMDPFFLEEMIKRQLIEKNPKLLENKVLLEETIRKALKDHKIIPKSNNVSLPNQGFSPPSNKQDIPKNEVPKPETIKTEITTMDLLDIGYEKNEVKTQENSEFSNEKREENEKKPEQQLFEKIEEAKTEKAEVKIQKFEKIEKKQIVEEIKAKYDLSVNSCQFKFESTLEIANSLHNMILTHVDKNQITIDKSFIMKVLENLEYLRKCQVENRELEEKYQITIQDYNKMQERLVNQENLLKNIEFTYQEKIHNIEYKNQENINVLVIENKSLKNMIENQQRSISLQIESSKEEISQFQELIKKIQKV